MVIYNRHASIDITLAAKSFPLITTKTNLWRLDLGVKSLHNGTEIHHFLFIFQIDCKFCIRPFSESLLRFKFSTI